MKEKSQFRIVFVLSLVVLHGNMFCCNLLAQPVRSVATKQSENTNLTRKNINAILEKSKINKSEFGILIEKNNEIIFDLNADKVFIPASISKLYTAYSALKKLGPSFKVSTELYFDDKNLYLKGGGDPGFVSETLWFLVNEFFRLGITEISGDIVVDDSLFDQVRFDQSRESTRVDRAFDSPVGAMSFNWNSVNIYVSPASKLNQSGIVTLDPASLYFSLVNKVTTVKSPKKDIVIDVNQKQRRITVSGDVGIDLDEKVYFKNVADPLIWSGENLKSFLLQRGIVTKGKVRSGFVPAKAKKVARAEGKPLSEMVTDMNKFSNNFVAEMLTKLMAMPQKSTGISLSDGLKTINSYIEKLYPQKNDVIFVNPSGFSRENKLSARSMNTLLFAAQKDFLIFPSFLESLPIAGIDGTLKKRMKNSNAEGFVRAKTGYLNGVVTIAGYAGDNNGDIYHFSFLYNGPHDEIQIRTTVDQVLISLLQ